MPPLIEDPIRTPHRDPGILVAFGVFAAGASLAWVALRAGRVGDGSRTPLAPDNEDQGDFINPIGRCFPTSECRFCTGGLVYE